MRRELVALALGLSLAACLPLDPPEGALACAADGDCPSGWTCRASRCYRADGTMDGGARDGAQPERDGASPMNDATPGEDAGRSDAGPPPLPVCTTCIPGSNEGCSGENLCFMDWVRGCTFCQERTGVDAGSGEACWTSADCRAGFECLRGQCREQCDPAVGACTDGSQYCFDMAAPDTGGLCLQPCLPGGGNCPFGESCHVLFSWTGERATTCAPEGDVPRYGRCDYRSQFCGRNDYCARASSPTVCFPACSSGEIVGCPPDFDFCLTYQPVAPTGARPGACFKTCGTTADCDEGFTCVAYNEVYSLCIPKCTTNADCDVGETCTPEGVCTR